MLYVYLRWDWILPPQFSSFSLPSSLLESSKTNREMFTLCLVFFFYSCSTECLIQCIYHLIKLVFAEIREWHPRRDHSRVSVGFTDIIFSCVRHLHPVICLLPFRIRSTVSFGSLLTLPAPCSHSPWCRAISHGQFSTWVCSSNFLGGVAYATVRTLPAPRSGGSHAIAYSSSTSLVWTTPAPLRK